MQYGKVYQEPTEFIAHLVCNCFRSLHNQKYSTAAKIFIPPPHAQLLDLI